MDRTIAIVTMAFLIFIGVTTCILQTINYSLTESNSTLNSYMVQPHIPVGAIIAVLIVLLIIPAVSAMTVTVKKTVRMRLIHLIIMCIATTAILALLCQEIWTLGLVGDSYPVTMATGVTVDSSTLCVARDSRIGNFIFMLVAFLILVANLIYTAIVYYKSGVSQDADAK